MQRIALCHEIGLPAHLALGHLIQSGLQPVELIREAALLAGELVDGDQPGVKDLSPQIGGLQQRDKIGILLGDDRFQRAAGEDKRPLPAAQLLHHLPPQAGLFIEFAQRRLLRALAAIYIATAQAVAGGDAILHQQQLILMADGAGRCRWASRFGTQGWQRGKQRQQE